jgi:hypothetical protein
VSFNDTKVDWEYSLTVIQMWEDVIHFYGDKMINVVLPVFRVKGVVFRLLGWWVGKVSSKDILLKCRTNVDRYSSAGWVGCALAFLALCKVGFVSGFCVPCNVLKIALGRVGKVMDV